MDERKTCAIIGMIVLVITLVFWILKNKSLYDFDRAFLLGWIISIIYIFIITIIIYTNII